MITVNDLYDVLNKKIPAELSCDWDNDGRMCIPTPEREVKRVLLCLDASMKAVDYAAANGFDCIVTHHPLIFSPMKNIDASVSGAHDKIVKLIKNGIAVLSFHTRLDKVENGVNDVLTEALGLYGTEAFSDVGKMGCVEKTFFKEFALKVKKTLGAEKLVCVDAGKKVQRIAVVGGSGKGYLAEAAEKGCDTFLTGEMPFNCEHDAVEYGVNLICAGHYYTENIVCQRLKGLIEASFGADCIYTEIFDTAPSFVL